jgi:8-oxo-dGTP diphosphatase
MCNQVYPNKTIKVVAAIIQNKDVIFATQRGYGEFKGKWEFPGGKIEKDESPEDALIREIKEELNTLISVDLFFKTIEYNYPTFHLSMDCFLCHVINGSLELKEHINSSWLKKEDLFSVDWLPADLNIVASLSK